MLLFGRRLRLKGQRVSDLPSHGGNPTSAIRTFTSFVIIGSEMRSRSKPSLLPCPSVYP